MRLRFPVDTELIVNNEVLPQAGGAALMACLLKPGRDVIENCVENRGIIQVSLIMN